MVQAQPINAEKADSGKTIYRDGSLARCCIGLLSWRMAQITGTRSDRRGYDGFVDASLRLMRGQTAEAQREQVGKLLRSFVPAPVLWGIRTLFSPTRWVCESNAWFASQLFVWLIGPCDRVEVEVTDESGKMRVQRSGVHIQKCRYLEAAGCVGACINLCKMPTQQFFTEEFGIPFTMEPNFEDLSCKMIFGQYPPALETEEIYGQPCLKGQSEFASAQVKPCPKIDV